MLYVSTRVMHNYDSMFELREIYVSDGRITYILRKSEGYIPVMYRFPIQDIKKDSTSLPFSPLAFGPMRQYDDDDPKSLAFFLRDKIKSVDMKLPNAEKVLYDVLSNFGDPNDG